MRAHKAKNIRLRELNRLRSVMRATEFGQVAQGIMLRVDSLERKLWNETHAKLKLAERKATQECYQIAIDAAIEQYGNGNGVLISGCVRDHFPDYVQNLLRGYARRISDCTDEAFAHWKASGNRAVTLRRMLNQ